MADKFTERENYILGNSINIEWFLEAINKNNPLHPEEGAAHTESYELNGQNILVPRVRIKNGKAVLNKENALEEALEKGDYIIVPEGENPDQYSKDLSKLIGKFRGFSEGGVVDNFKSDLEMDRQELMDEGFDPDYNDRDDSLTGDPTSRTDLAKSLGKAGFAGLALIARQLGFDFYPTEDTERNIEERFGFAEGGDTYGMADQMEQLDFFQPSLAAPPLKKPKATSRRPGFRGDGPFDFKGFGSYLKEQVSQEELTAGLDNAGEWMVPFYEAGSNMANVISEYNKPEDERDYDYIKEELGKAGNSAATEAAMWIMGGVAVKYGGKGIKAIADKVKQYEIDPNTTSAFGVGAIKKKAAEPLEIGINTALEDGKFLKGYDASTAADMAEKAKNATAGNTRANALMNAAVPEGTRVGVRLNLNSTIPDMPRGLDKLQTLHKGSFSGKAMSYLPFATVRNVTFNVSQKGRTAIASRIKQIDTPEAKAKYPAMSVDGDYVPNKNLLDQGGDLVEIGLNPGAHHLFIDLKTGQAVKGAEEATVIGDRVYAKGVEYWKKAEAPAPIPTQSGVDIPSDVRFRFKKGGMAMKKQMGYALGGDVEIDAESGNEVPPGSRPEEVRDDIPAMLSEGEYVVPADVTRYYGVKFFEDLRDQAKVELAEMDATGRIGGEPVPQDEDDLTQDEMALLDEVMGMNQGGMVPQMNQQQMINPIPSVAPQMQQMQPPMNQPNAVNMNQGGMIGQRPNTDAFGNPIGPSTPTTPTAPVNLQPIDPSGSNIYGLAKGKGDDPTSSIQVQGPISQMPTSPTGDGSGMKSTFYIHKDGRRISVLMLNGRPISVTPADFNEFLEDTPENRAKLNFSEGGAGGGTGGTVTEGTQGTDTDDDYGLSTDVYKTTAEGGGVKDVTTPEGAQKTYTDSGVDVNDTVGAAKKALDSATAIPREAGMIAGAINPFLGLAVGAGNVAGQLTAVSKAQANKRMAEFLGKTEDANAIQADIDRFLQNAPGAVRTFDSALAKGDQRFQDALAAATSVNAPDEAVIYLEDSDGTPLLNEVGRANLKEYTDSFKTDATTSRGVSIRPMLRPEGFEPSIAQIQDKLDKGLELSDAEKKRLEGVETTRVEAEPQRRTRTDNPKVTLGKTLDTGVIGNNTSGRNTASQNLANSLTPNDGKVYVDGVLREEKVQTYSPQEVSQAEDNASAATNDWVAATNAAKNVSTDDPRAWYEAMQAQSEASRKATAAIQERTRARNNDNDPSNDSPSSGGGCCFIMLEARYGDGTMDEVVRRYRDEYMTDRNRRGYYRTAEVLVPLMRKSKVFKWVITKTFADPLVSYGKYYYGQNKHGVIYSPVKNFWMKVFDVVGGDTKFIRENGEVV